MSNIRKQIENKLYHLDEEPGSDDSGKPSMWKRPLLRRDEKKPSLIDVIPSIHPTQPPPEEKKKSFGGLFGRSKKEKDQEQKTE